MGSAIWLAAMVFAPGAGEGCPLLEGREFVFESAPFAECHASTLVELPGGAILAAWFGGTEEGSPDVAIWAARRDPGERPGSPRWSAPRKVASGDGVPCWNPVLFRREPGKIWLFYKVGPSPERWSGAIAASADGGETFGPPEILPAGILGPVKDKPILLPSGDLLCGSSVESYKVWSVWVERLSGDGRSWRKFGPITCPGHPHGIIQPTLFLGDRPGEVFLLARSRGVGKVCRAASSDGGMTWSDAVPTDLPNPNSGIDCVRLADGRVLLVYNHTRSGRTPLDIALSKDLGSTWARVLLLEDEPGEYSYPAVIQLEAGDVAVTYTWKRKRIGFARIPLKRLDS